MLRGRWKDRGLPEDVTEEAHLAVSVGGAGCGAEGEIEVDGDGNWAVILVVAQVTGGW